MTEKGAKTDTCGAPSFQVALAHDTGTAKGSLFGLTDLFTFAKDFAARRQEENSPPPVRITHWQAAESGPSILCTYDSYPGPPHALSAVIVPNNFLAVADSTRESHLIPWLRLKHAEGCVLAGVCGGVFILAKTGLLSGRQATTHWSLNDEFSAMFPDVFMDSDHMVIDYGDVMTAGGTMAWADLGLRLIERFLGAAVMYDTARYMNIDPPPAREPRFYSGFEPRIKHGDAAILNTQHWLSANRAKALTVTDMARSAGLEPRTFLRRFVQATGLKPSDYQRRLRMMRAREMLEFSRSSVEAIASGVGFDDVRSFRRIFHSVVGLTPSDYRRRFSRLLRRAPSPGSDRRNARSASDE
jgi:transcriptional regulator GlxA family with amidase domain